LAIAATLGSGLCAYGLVVATDTAFDLSKPRLFPVILQGKAITGSRSQTYNLDVPNWSDQPAARISVSSDFYAKVSPGQPICLARHAGALGIGWFDLETCPPGVSPAPSYYPFAAMRANKEGKATVQCDVVSGARLANCRTLSETPPGWGFGAAAVARLSSADFKPKPGQFAGKTTIQMTVVFHLES
jgi:TonB family protein